MSWKDAFPKENRYFETKNGILCNNDALEILKQMPDNYIDTVITDPPYGLSKHSEKTIREVLGKWLSGEEDYVPQKKGFMGKAWDAFVPPPALWKEVYRIMKPGGTILVFAGARTQDLMAMSLRLAGFEIKDTLMWLFGQGFPKATDISKMIDKRDTEEFRKLVGQTIRYYRKKKGLTMDELCAKLGLNSEGHGGMINHYENGRATPTIEIWEKLCEILEIKEIQNYHEQKSGRLKEVGKIENPISWFGKGIKRIATTLEAKQWEGYKSHGLKPAYEPIIMAMKPNEGSYAENALKWNVAGLNIDGARIPTTQQDEYDLVKRPISKASNKPTNINFTGRYKDLKHGVTNQGRFPANILLDEEAAKMLDESFATAKGWGCSTKSPLNGKTSMFGFGGVNPKRYDFDTNPSRFFYVAKASAKERNMGLSGDLRNIHPTVKPLKLIEYLVKLTSMPNENQIYLDPFLGSGTTAMACEKLQRKWIGIELNSEYCEIAKARIEYWCKQFGKSKENVKRTASKEIEQLKFNF